MEAISVEEFQCGICLRILFEPICTPCGHVFCRRCLLLLFSTANKKLCSMCRSSLKEFTIASQSPNVMLTQVLNKLFPKEIEERTKEDNQEKEDEKHILRKKLAIGNLHEVEPSESTNNHRWTVFVKDLTEDEGGKLDNFVEKVVFKLHPTFSPSTVEVTTPPYAVRRVSCAWDMYLPNKWGWGTFNVGIKVYFKTFLAKPPLEFSHHLVFSHGGSSAAHEVQFDKRKCFFLQQHVAPTNNSEPEHSVEMSE